MPIDGSRLDVEPSDRRDVRPGTSAVPAWRNAYLLDADVFIASKNNHCEFDFCPAFWDWLDGANEAGVVHSVERVYEELIVLDDELSEWSEGLMADISFSGRAAGPPKIGLHNENEHPVWPSA